MMRNYRLLGLLVLTAVVVLLSCSSNGSNKGKEGKSTQEVAQVKTSVVPVVCLYSLGSVNPSLRDAMLDSLKAHYPKCKFVKTVALPKDAITKKRHDHVRYRTEIINRHLAELMSDSTIVLALTEADVGKDNFRGQPHWGIFGEANGFGNGVAVVSAYRLHSNAELFRAI